MVHVALMCFRGGAHEATKEWENILSIFLKSFAFITVLSYHSGLLEKSLAWGGYSQHPAPSLSLDTKCPPPHLNIFLRLVGGVA